MTALTTPTTPTQRNAAQVELLRASLTEREAALRETRAAETALAQRLSSFEVGSLTAEYGDVCRARRVAQAAAVALRDSLGEPAPVALSSELRDALEAR